MSYDHSNCSGGAGGAAKRCDCGEDGCDNEKLWNDFEHCAQAVTRLYGDPTWKSLQTAAAGTTQLYKSSIDSYKRGFDKGFQAGRSVLAKEILAAFSSGTKLDFNSLLGVLYQNMRMSSDEGAHLNTPMVASSETAAAMQLFQQALTQHTTSSSPHRDRTPDLNSFLASQVQRHRKTPALPNLAFVTDEAATEGII
ncbi:unnamed protein product [Caenorhabditis auriculariae]|uniref:Uncharacterized protein n=1 Tax=Caenorhabditis auriculariae TaxID=2777116 RepID=A0A8S1GTN8_9PELO|nr:unnamed protein product [Caenorhabditis auriculariae]